MSQFPRVQELIPQLPEGHFAAGLKLSDPIVHALEFFLSLDQVPGFAEKLRDLKLKCVGPATTNAGAVQWAGVRAELEGICLLGRTLDLPIVGFDEHFSRALRANSDCDVVVLVNGNRTYVEIKGKAAEDEQRSLPRRLDACLVQLQSELPYDISVELRNPRYDCSDLDSLPAKVKEWPEIHRLLQEQGLSDSEEMPPMGGPICINFHAKSDPPPRGIPVHFDPDGAIDAKGDYNLKPWLVGPGDGKSKIPMVEQAHAKGADYLLCRVSGWDGWEEIVRNCFGSVSWKTRRTCFASDVALSGLRGVVLFSDYDDFSIVNNPSTEGGSWIVV